MNRKAIFLTLLLGCVSVPAPARAAAATTPAQQAGKLYSTAMSQLRTRQYKQVAQLLEQFVRIYATHEHVPVAYLQLAYCRRQIKDFEGMERALDEVIKRFYGSAAWFRAYGAKIDRAKRAGDREKYLTLLEEMVKRSGQAPLRMHGTISRSSREYHRYEYRVQNLAPSAVMTDSLIRPGGWILDIVRMSDTPERAQRALKVLRNTLDAKRRQLPVDWEVGHVLLLRQAGETEQAEKTFQEYADAWGDDPRAMGLWVLAGDFAQQQDDPERADAAYRRLIEKYAGSHSLAIPLHQRKSRSAPLYRRMLQLARAKRYEQFVPLAQHYLKSYRGDGWCGDLFELWMKMARRRGEKGEDTSRLTEVLEALNAFGFADSPARQRTMLIWKIDLLIHLGKLEEAAKLAQQLIGEAHWSAESYGWVKSFAERNEVFTEVVKTAEQKWSIPAPDPDSEPPSMLQELRSRLKEDQTRHAEEIGEELFANHRDAAATIEAVKALADYYFGKVLREPRDKWTDRMIDAYPYHPLTQAVLANKIETEHSEKRSEKLASTLDMMMERFPSARPRNWYNYRLSCFDVAKDPEGKLEFVRLIHGKLAEAGDITAIDELSKYELLPLQGEALGKGDYKAIGDYWMEKATKFTGTRTGLHCLTRAYGAYYSTPYHWRHRGAEVQWDDALKVIQLIQTQKIDPERRWRMEFEDVNLLARRGDGKAALNLLNDRLEVRKKYRDLSLRVDFAALGRAAVKSKAGNAVLKLAKALRRNCYTTRDLHAIELMQATMFWTAKQYVPAAGHYLNIVEGARWAALRHGFFNQALDCLRRGASPETPGVIRSYIKKIPNVQEFVPNLYYELGAHYLRTRDVTVFQVRKTLAKRYPASSALDRLDKLIVQAERRGKRG